MTNKINITGVGVGLRAQHYEVFLKHHPEIPWLEVLADNYLNTQGIPLEKLFTITAHYPVVMHCVGMSLGSIDPINWEYLSHIKALATQLKPAWISDHLCWTSLHNQYSHGLLPLPFTQETIDHTANRIQQIQDYLNYPLLIENISSYVRCPENEMNEVTFLNHVAQQADCGILLDINNLYVNAHNHHEDAMALLQQVDASRVYQYHLAGYQPHGTLLLDSHNNGISPAVWQLYETALKRIGPKPACIEWDEAIPDWSVLATEQQQAARLHQRYEAISA